MIWCAEHKASVGPDDPLDGPEDHCLRWYYDWDHSNSPTFTDCRMVEALLIVKENGEWPEWVIAALGGAVKSTQHYIVRRGLDALASAGGDSQ